MTLSPVLWVLPTVPWTLYGCREASPKTRPASLLRWACVIRSRNNDPPLTEYQTKKPAAASAGRAVNGRRSYLMRYVRTPPSGLKDSTEWPAFFIASAMNPRTVCFCHPIVCTMSARVAPFLRRSMATTWAVLLPRPGAAISGVRASCLALGAFFMAVALRDTLLLTGAAIGPGAPPFAWYSAFGLAGCAGWGGTEPASPPRRFQMRVAAAWWSLNFWIGGTPGRLFQIATSRVAGQDLASSTNSCGLVKLSNGLAVVAAASSGVECAMIWLSGSIVKVVIVVVLGAARFAVITWITSLDGEMQDNSEATWEAIGGVPAGKGSTTASVGLSSRPELQKSKAKRFPPIWQITRECPPSISRPFSGSVGGGKGIVFLDMVRTIPQLRAVPGLLPQRVRVRLAGTA